jgi:uncharacterized protein YjiS (DUF1127 family)
MRDYVLTRAIAEAEAPLIAFFKRTLRNWRARRTIASLAEHDDALLRDIGVTRGEIDWAANLPLHVNAAHELEARSYRRRRGERHG